MAENLEKMLLCMTIMSVQFSVVVQKGLNVSIHFYFVARVKIGFVLGSKYMADVR